jgi:hypothetical protein
MQGRHHDVRRHSLPDVVLARRVLARRVLARAVWIPAALGAAVWLGGCNATLRHPVQEDGLGGASGSDGASGGSNVGSGGVVDCTLDQGPAVGPLLKLSTVQYRSTVGDLLASFGLDSVLGDIEPLLQSVPDDSLGDGFRGLDDRVALEHVQGFLDVGTAIGDAVAADPALLELVAGDCITTEPLADDCWESFLDGFLARAYRRPLSTDERVRMDELRDLLPSPTEQVRAAIVIALSSPRFVYHVEVDGTVAETDPNLLYLDAYELGNRLAYTFWQTMPDDRLFEAAADGSLLEPEVYEAELLRVWDDARTHNTLRQFWTEWLRLEKFTGFETTRPAFQALAAGENFGEPGHDHYADMVQEIHDLTELFTFERPGTVADLLTTNLSVTQSDDLASLYGVPAWDGAGEYPTFPVGERAGLLQRGALLVSNLEQTNPFHRGALIRRHVLCDTLPQPDPNLLPPGSLDPPPVDEAQTTRERFQAKVEGNGLCQTCHAGFSTIGYVLEAYDAIGRYRSLERVYDEQNGDLLATLSLDTTGVAAITSLDEPEVSGPAELNQAIVQSGKVEACLAEGYFQYVARRAAQAGSLDSCVVGDLARVLSQTEGGLAVAFRALAADASFKQRRVGSQ